MDQHAICYGSIEHLTFVFFSSHHYFTSQSSISHRKHLIKWLRKPSALPVNPEQLALLFKHSFIHLFTNQNVCESFTRPVFVKHLCFKRIQVLSIPIMNVWCACPHLRTFEPPHDKTNKMAFASSKDSDQPGHPPSLIRVFTVCMKKAWVLSYPLSAQ